MEKIMISDMGKSLYR